MILSLHYFPLPNCWSRFLKFGVMSIASAMLASCQNMAESGSVYYNVGLANSVNTILLKNIIRSAKDYPLYYSALGDFSYELSRDVSFSPSIDVPINVGGGAIIDGDIDIGLSPSAETGRDRSTTVSSLETADFTRAIHADLTPQMLVFFTSGHSRTEWSLLMMLTIDVVTITHQDYENVATAASKNCFEVEAKKSTSVRAICHNLMEQSVNNRCADHPVSNNAIYITMRNEPSNPCEFVLFRKFIESIVASDPIFEIQDNGTVQLTLQANYDRFELFQTDGTGIVLRSPHEMIHYLGKIVRLTFQGLDDGLLLITAASGEQVPIILVEEGRHPGKAAVETMVDGVRFSIPEQSIRTPRTHFSFVALAALKSLISLNTSQEQLSSVPTTVIVQ